MDCNDRYGHLIQDEPLKNHYNWTQNSLPNAFCNDYNSRDNDGCTKCKIDTGFICRNLNTKNGPTNHVFR